MTWWGWVLYGVMRKFDAVSPRTRACAAAAAAVGAMVIVSGATREGAGQPALLVNGTVVTMDRSHRVLSDGHVLVGDDGRIEAVWSGATPTGVSTAGAKVVDTGPRGLVFPGLVNVHTHASYAVLPTWPVPASDAQPADGRPTGREPFDFRYEWGGGTGGPGCWASPPWSPPAEELRLVEHPVSALIDGDRLGLTDQVIVYAEARAALGGETAIDREPPSTDNANGLIVRHVEGGEFPATVEARVKTVDHCLSVSDAADLAVKMNTGKVQAWLVHLAEGVRNGDRERGDTFSSRSEFTTIRKLRLLTPATVIVHGIALERRDFALMHAVGAKLVWSPLSNLMLYGRTTNVYDALAESVPVSLGTDWAATGSGTLLDELKIADITLRDPRLLGGSRGRVPALASDVTLDRALVDMVTRNPAQALHWPVGSVESGNHADLLVIGRPADSPTGHMPDSPYRSLIDATERDVRLVLVDGKPVAGDPQTMALAGATGIAIVRSTAGRYSKGVAFRSGLPKSSLRLGAVTRILTGAMHALGGDHAAPASGQPPSSSTFTFLHALWNHGEDKTLTDAQFLDVLRGFAHLFDGRLNLERIDLAPLLTDDNHFYFSVLEGKHTPTGLPADQAPPFHLYPANVNQATTGNPFDTVFERWYH